MPKLKDINTFIEQANIIHNNKYNYSESVYINAKTKIKIKCNIHGYFFINPDKHLIGQGCQKCFALSRGKKKRLTHDEFILRCKKVHNDKYIYDKVKYITNEHKVIIVCKKHGEFKIRPSHHFHGVGCPQCSSSMGENIIRNFLNNYKINFIEQKSFSGLKLRGLLRFDFYLPEHMTIIEYHGKQHYYPMKVFGGLKNYLYRNKSDNLKYDYCLFNGINYIEVPYFFNQKEIHNYLLGNINGII